MKFKLPIIVPTRLCAGRQHRLLRFEPLERRQMLTVFFVNVFADVANPGPLDDGVVDVDPDTPGNQVSLRAAIQEANATPGDDIVRLPAGVYSLTRTATSGDTDADGDLDVRNDTGNSTSDLLTIVGASNVSTVLDGRGIDRVFSVAFDGRLVVQGVTIQGGVATDSENESILMGGAIFNRGDLELASCVIENNSAEAAGGIYNTGTLTVDLSTIANNTATIHGGGGILQDAGSTTISNSTLRENQSVATGGGIAANGGELNLKASLVLANETSDTGTGGGVFALSTDLFVTNSTFTGNSSGDGGGLYIQSFFSPPSTGNAAFITNCTIVDNTAAIDASGGGIAVFGIALALNNTIVANNSAGSAASDIVGSIDSTSRSNLIGVDSDFSGIADGQQGNQIGTAQSPIDPLLAPLANYGGPTLSMPPLFASLAIDKGDNDAADGIPFDQRGLDRVVNLGANSIPTVDVGAVEDQVPLAVSITALDASPTNQNELRFSVTFNTPVSSVTASSFQAVTDPGVLFDSIGISGSGTQYTVTVFGVSGDGTLRLDLADDDTIVDQLQVPLGGAGTGNGDLSGDTYEIDQTPPEVASVARLSPLAENTNASEVRFELRFSESVLSVQPSDLELLTGGSIAGAQITSVVEHTSSIPSNTDTWYEVIVNTGTGTGTLGLQLAGSPGVFDAAGNRAQEGAPATNEHYAVDRTLPIVQSILRQTPAGPITNATTVTYEVTFSEPVSNVDQDDFHLELAGVTFTDLNVSSSSGQVYIVTISGIVGDGTLRLDVVDNDTIEDAIGNLLAAGATGETYQFDRQSPTVTSVVRVQSQRTNLAQVAFDVTFSEQVNGVDAADFVPLAGSQISGSSIDHVESLGGTNPTYRVWVNTGSGDDVLALGSALHFSVFDATGNPAIGTMPSSAESYIIDKTAPAVLAIRRLNPQDTPTSATSVTYEVTFSEDVAQADVQDFVPHTNGVDFQSLQVIQDSANRYLVTIAGIAGIGDLRLDLVNNGSIVDPTGNALSAGLEGETYEFDQTAPVIASIVRVQSERNNLARVAFDVTFSEQVHGVDTSDFQTRTAGHLANASIIAVETLDDGIGLKFRVLVSTGTGDGTLGLKLAAQASLNDASGNSPAAGEPALSESYIIDKTAPAILSIQRLNANPTNQATIRFRVTFSENVLHFDEMFLELVASPSIQSAKISSLSGSGNVYDVTVDTGTGDGTLGLDLVNASGLRDEAGNELDASHLSDDRFVGEAYTVNKSIPRVESITRMDPDPTAADKVHFKVKFTEPVTGFDVSDLRLVADAGGDAAIESIEGSGDEYIVTVRTGTSALHLGLNLVDDNSIVDVLNMELQGIGILTGDFAGEAYTLNRGEPTIPQSLTAGPEPPPPLLQIVQFQPPTTTSAAPLPLMNFFSTQLTHTGSVINPAPPATGPRPRLSPIGEPAVQETALLQMISEGNEVGTNTAELSDDTQVVKKLTRPMQVAAHHDLDIGSEEQLAATELEGWGWRRFAVVGSLLTLALASFVWLAARSDGRAVQRLRQWSPNRWRKRGQGLPTQPSINPVDQLRADFRPPSDGTAWNADPATRIDKL